MKHGIRGRFLAAVLVLAGATAGAAPAHADPVLYARVARLVVAFDVVDPVSGGVVAHTSFETTPNGVVVYTPEEAPSVDGIDTTSLGVTKCRPGGFDVYGTITARNIVRDVLWRFHDDTRFFWNCKIIESIPFNSVYGSDYSWFWKWDKKLIDSRTGARKKFGAVEGSAQLVQRFCLIVACQDLAGATPDIRYTIDYLGHVRAVAHG